MAATLELLGNRTKGVPALVIVLVCLGVLGAALAFEHIGGLAPCVLCIYQRWGYTLAGLFGLLAWKGRGSAQINSFAYLGAFAAFLGEAGIAFFHVGVEQLWWQGTAECQGTALDGDLSLDALKEQLLNQPVVRCDQIPWELFGISMAGYNVLIALILAGFCFWVLRQKAKA